MKTAPVQSESLQPSGNKSPRPLLGFGWAGVAAGALSAALVVLALAGVDLVDGLLRALMWVRGAGALDWFVDIVLPQHGVALIKEPRFGLVGLSAALVATQSHPRRPGALALMALATWALLAPIISHILYAADFYDLFPKFDP